MSRGVVNPVVVAHLRGAVRTVQVAAAAGRGEDQGGQKDDSDLGGHGNLLWPLACFVPFGGKSVIPQL